MALRWRHDAVAGVMLLHLLVLVYQHAHYCTVMAAQRLCSCKQVEGEGKLRGCVRHRRHCSCTSAGRDSRGAKVHALDVEGGGGGEPQVKA